MGFNSGFKGLMDAFRKFAKAGNKNRSTAGRSGRSESRNAHWQEV